MAESPFDIAQSDTALASAAPVRVSGTRARAGNAMGRTRSGILEATGRAIEKYGVRRATMADVASVAGIAKGTLYNHFRTKGDLLTAALEAGVAALELECLALADGLGEHGLAAALQHAAETLSAHPALARVAAQEPVELVRLLQPGSHGAWPGARAAVGRVLAAAGFGAADATSPLVTVTDAAGPYLSAPDAAGPYLSAPEVTGSDVTGGDPTAEASTQGDLAASDRPPRATVGPAQVADASPRPGLGSAASLDPAVVETVLRWLVSYTGSPGVPGESAVGAVVLASAVSALSQP